MPFFFLLLIGIEYWLADYDFRESFFRRVVIDLIFLNVTHNAVTIATILGLPEMREWNTYHFNSPKFWLESGVAFLGITFFFFYVFQNISDFWTYKMMEVILLVIPIHHALSQSFGLSCMYHSKDKNPDVVKIVNWERVFSLMFLSSMMILAISYRLVPYKLSLRYPEFLGMIKSIFIYANIFSLAGMFFIFTRYREGIRHKKIFFGARYIVWTGTIFSPVAFIGTRVLHGMEYAFVTHKIFMKSQGTKKWHWLVGITLFIIAIGFIRLDVAYHMRQTVGKLLS